MCPQLSRSHEYNLYYLFCNWITKRVDNKVIIIIIINIIIIIINIIIITILEAAGGRTMG